MFPDKPVVFARDLFKHVEARIDGTERLENKAVRLGLEIWNLLSPTENCALD